jgi:hypothetical protein
MEEALIAYLLAGAGVVELVEARVFPGSRPQRSALPSIVFARVDGAPLYADEGEVGLEDSRIQIDCWGDTYKSAKLTARAVIARLSAFDGTVSGVAFQYVMLDAERDFRENGSNAAEYLFRTSLDFIVWNERT